MIRLNPTKCTLPRCPCCNDDRKACGVCEKCIYRLWCQCITRTECCGLPKQRCVCPFCPLTMLRK